MTRTDFNGDGRDDILWWNEDGSLSNWLGRADGGFTVNDAAAKTSIGPGGFWEILATGDFNGDGRDDLLWVSDGSDVSNWLGTAIGGFIINDGNAFTQAPAGYSFWGVGDFNGDGRDDILWSNGYSLATWSGTASGGFVKNLPNTSLPQPNPSNVVGVGDFNGDGRDDILWYNVETGGVFDWLATPGGAFSLNQASVQHFVPNDWQVAGVGDFNGDGRDDILWRNINGALSNWLATESGGFVINDANAFTFIPLDWQVVGVGDYNGDGRADILWRNDNGAVSDWLGTATGGFVVNDPAAYAQVENSWHIGSNWDPWDY